MPRYNLSDVHRLAASGCVIVVNRRARNNLLELQWEISRLLVFLQCLKAKHFRGDRAQLSAFDGRRTVDADKYSLRFDEESETATTDQNCCEFFVELAVEVQPGGASLLIVSFHLDGQP